MLRTINDGPKKIKRHRRHQLRKVILALDYIVECIGCILILFIFLIGEQYLLQHIFLTVGIFIYGVPIPIAYLLNETRVRNVIVNKGWIEGIKAIFYSSDQIKQTKRQQILGSLHQKRISKMLSTKARMPISFKGTSPEHISAKRLRRLEQTKDRSETNGGNISDEEVKEAIEASPSSVLLEKNTNVKIIINALPIYDNDEGDFRKSTEDNGADMIVKSKKVPDSCPSKPFGAKIERPINHVDEYDKIEVVSEFCEPNEVHFTPNLKMQKNAKIRSSMFADASLIKSTFPENANVVLSILANGEFKTFARTHILNHILNDLNRHSNESDYHKYFKYLCYLDKIPQSQNDREKNTNLIVSLINAWYLSKTNNEYVPDAKIGDAFSTNENSGIDSINEMTSNQTFERKRLIRLLLFNASLDDQYSTCLNELCDMEQNQIDQETIDYW